MKAASFLLILPLVAQAVPSSPRRAVQALAGRHDGQDDDEALYAVEVETDSDGEGHVHILSDIDYTPSAQPEEPAGGATEDDQTVHALGSALDADHDHPHAHPDTGIPAPSAFTSGAKASLHEAAAHAAQGHHHSHGAHSAPIVALNDTDIHYWHSFPPSYLAADFRLDEDSAIFGEEFPPDWRESGDGAGGEGGEESERVVRVRGIDTGKRGWMVLHVVGMCVAYFGALPISLALRAANHAAHHLANLVFLGITLLGWSAAAVYKARTPDRYTGESHSGLGNMLVLLSLGLSLLDSLDLLKRAAQWYRRTPPGKRSWRVLRRDLFESKKDTRAALAYELAARESGDHDAPGGTYRDGPYARGRADEQVVFASGDDVDCEDVVDSLSRQEAARQPQRSRRSHGSTSSHRSSGSEYTLRDSPCSGTPPIGFPFAMEGATGRGPMQKHIRPLEMGAYDLPLGGPADEEIAPDDLRALLPSQPVVYDAGHTGDVRRRKSMTIQRFGEVCLTWIRRSQVVLAYVAVLSGIAIYTGMCRASFLPSCLAHYIKGSIFFGYGVLTFARYLGAYADMGWSWNRAPAGYRGPSAEMVECAVIFTYGITNTWMERFGAQAGDAYTVKQVQHISIAVMFWFAGLTGMLLEIKIIRRVLGSAVGRSAEEPASYALSFNPLPALVIAVTGLAMAAHHQTYLFQIQIHSLWGVLLAGGSLFRMLTYIFLYLRPPVDSALPSRPPTEILTAFGWATGGIVFILSSEEVTYAAMRAGYDDVMACLNVTVALTALVFCWEVVVLGVKGWAVGRVRGERMRDVEI